MSTYGSFAGCLQSVVVEAEKLRVLVLPVSNFHDKRNPVFGASLCGSATGHMVDHKRRRITPVALEALVPQKLNRLGSSYEVPTSAAITSKLLDTIRIVFAPLSHLAELPLVHAAPTLASFLGELVQRKIVTTHDAGVSHIHVMNPITLESRSGRRVPA